MDTGIIALIGVGCTFIATVIAVIALGEKRGRMAQRLDEAEEDIDQAHEKIGQNRDTIIRVDKSLVELTEGQRHIASAIEELKTDVKSHIKEG